MVEAGQVAAGEQLHALDAVVHGVDVQMQGLGQVHFMETSDAIGPLGAESMSESPFNPVAPAFANALRDATGIRFTELPLTRDRVWLALDAAARG